MTNKNLQQKMVKSMPRAQAPGITKALRSRNVSQVFFLSPLSLENTRHARGAALFSGVQSEDRIPSLNPQPKSRMMFRDRYSDVEGLA